MILSILPDVKLKITLANSLTQNSRGPLKDLRLADVDHPSAMHAKLFLCQRVHAPANPKDILSINVANRHVIATRGNSLLFDSPQPIPQEREHDMPDRPLLASCFLLD